MTKLRNELEEIFFKFPQFISSYNIKNYLALISLF